MSKKQEYYEEDGTITNNRVNEIGSTSNVSTDDSDDSDDDEVNDENINNYDNDEQNELHEANDNHRVVYVLGFLNIMKASIRSRQDMLSGRKKGI